MDSVLYISIIAILILIIITIVLRQKAIEKKEIQEEKKEKKIQERNLDRQQYILGEVIAKANDTAVFEALHWYNWKFYKDKIDDNVWTECRKKFKSGKEQYDVGYNGFCDIYVEENFDIYVEAYNKSLRKTLKWLEKNKHITSDAAAVVYYNRMLDKKEDALFSDEDLHRMDMAHKASGYRRGI